MTDIQERLLKLVHGTKEETEHSKLPTKDHLEELEEAILELADIIGGKE